MSGSTARFHRGRKSGRRKRRFLYLCLLIILLSVSLYRLITPNTSELPLERYAMSSPTVYKATLAELSEQKTCTIDQSLMLINTSYPLANDFDATIAQYGNSGVWMDPCMHEAYKALADAVKAETDDELYIADAARDRSEQGALYRDDPSVAQKPGCSEHEAGLALDVYVEGFSGMSFIKSTAGQFVNTHCFEYGFIIRYPSLSKDKTGIGYEPWHIRYVGKFHATLMHRYNQTLEEYIDSLMPNVFYKIDNNILSRQPLSNGYLQIPADCTAVHISPDNTGYYIVTGTVKDS